MNKIAPFAFAAFLAATSVTQAVETFEETVDQTYSLGDSPRISIQNRDGSIRIYAAAVTEVSLHASKRAYSQQRLDAINLNITTKPNSLTIETQFPPEPHALSFADRSGVVDYTLIVPMSTRITRCELRAGEILIEGLQNGSATAHLVNGWLGAHNCFIDLELSIVNGRLDVAYDWWQAEKPFAADANSINGTVRLLVPPDAALSIQADSRNGQVASNLNEDEPKQAGRSIATVLGTPGPSGAQLHLHSVNGNIRLDRSY
jgi:DUF4097 and DUF4098 domain-containing protein YvlB